MRELIGYLVAREGAEPAAARVAVGISQRFLCEHFLCKDDRADHALLHNESMGARSPMSVVCVRENVRVDAVAAIAGQTPG
jgi:hypothetical protein